MRSRHFLEYRLSVEIRPDELSQALHETFQVCGKARRVLQFYDSFDWRLHKAGLTLELEKSGRKTRLLCLRRKDGTIVTATPFEQTAMPQFVGAFQDPDLRARLTPILDVRALLPQIEIICEGTDFSSPQTDLIGICLADCRVASTDANLGTWLLAECQGKPSKALEELTASLSFTSLSLESLLNQALAAIQSKPPQVSPRPPIDPALRADSASKAILKRLVVTMEMNRPGVMARTDSEFLHDFRVAVRRTRAALGQLKGVFGETSVRRYISGFAWLGQLTGPARDLEVLLLNFDELKGQLPLSLRGGLDPLQRHVEAQLDRAYGQLILNLNSSRYASMIRGWQWFLDRAPASRPRALHALTPIDALASQRIQKVFRRALKQGRAINKDSPPADLHDLRKTCKKLRYLLEFFETLYPAAPFRQLLKQLKDLQNHLGEFQDIHAQIHMLCRMADELRQQRSVPTQTFLALGALIGQLEKRQTRLRKTFTDAFEQFSKAENRALLQDLLAATAA